jgi:hypothetical protein
MQDVTPKLSSRALRGVGYEPEARAGLLSCQVFLSGELLPIMLDIQYQFPYALS